MADNPGLERVRGGRLGGSEDRNAERGGACGSAEASHAVVLHAPRAHLEGVQEDQNHGAIQGSYQGGVAHGFHAEQEKISLKPC